MSVLQTTRPEFDFWTAQKWPLIREMIMTSQFVDMKQSSIFFDVVVFPLPSLIAGSSFISTSLLVLDLWQFSFVRDWPEIRKSKILPSKFCSIGQVRDSKRTNVCNEMLLNAKKYQVYSFYRFRVIKVKPAGDKIYPAHRD